MTTPLVPDTYCSYPISGDQIDRITLFSSTGISYNSLQFLGHGAKGNAFTAVQHGGSRDGMRVVVKIPNLDLISFREDEVRNRIKAVTDALRNELDPAKDLQKIPGVAPILDMGVSMWIIQHKHPFMDILPFSVYDFVSGYDLGEWCKKYHAVNNIFKGIRQVDIWFGLAKQLLTIMRSVHSCRILHGDIWPENVRINDAGNITIIDFGECWKLDIAWDHTGDVTYSKRHSYLAPERIQSDPNHRRKWYTPADIYSIGGVLLFLATGQDPPSPFKDGELKKNRQVKEEITCLLQAHNPEFLRFCPGVADIISVCMHPRAEDRVSRISPILDTIELFSPLDMDHPKPETIITQLGKEIKSLSQTYKRIKSHSSRIHPVFQRLVLRRIHQLHDELEPLASDLFILEGDRETHVNALLTCFDTLQPGDQVLALTSSQFWKPGNFGPYGRLLTKLLIAAQRGIRANWVVLVHNDPTEIDKEVLTYQKHAVEQFCIRMGKSDPSSFVGKDKQLYLGFCSRSPEEIQEMRRARKAFIMLTHEGEDILIAPDYKIGDYPGIEASISVETTVTCLRIWSNARRTSDLRRTHSSYVSLSKCILDWRLQLNK